MSIAHAAQPSLRAAGTFAAVSMSSVKRLVCHFLIVWLALLSGGAYAPSPGVVYPTMTLLLDMGLAEEQASEGPRKLLAITEAGRAHLDERADEVAVAIGRLTALARVSERTDAGPVRRAMGNLKQALHDCLSRDGTTRETQLEVARILDEAVGKIERL